MRVIGDTLTARLLLRELLANEVAVEWLVPEAQSVPGAGDLTLLPGPTLSLAQHSRNRWQTLAQDFTFPVLAPLEFYDLATTPGRSVKLREEALLDALAGEACAYLDKTPEGLHPRLVQGARYLPQAPHLADTLRADLTALLAAAGVVPQPVPATLDAAWLQTTPTTLTDMILAAQCLPQLYLQPCRVHVLTWALPQPLPLPKAPVLLLHRMPRGHTWLHLTSTQLMVWYDGAADPRQQTADMIPDAPTVAALTQHAGQLLPLFARLVQGLPLVQTYTAYGLADHLPLLGGLGAESPLWLAGGMGVREALYAPALAERLLELWRVDEYIESVLVPGRFAHIGPQARQIPESLAFTEPSPVAAPTEPVVTRPSTQLTPDAEVKRATEVRMVGKEVVSGGSAMLVSKSDKPKVQTSAIKN